MGLDIVELGMRVEEEFDVTIEDADYERLKTVRDLERYLEWRLRRTGSNGWPTYDIALVRGFCRIRREIMQQTGISRSQLRPSTRLAKHWCSRSEWRAASASLSATLQAPLPSWNAEGWMASGCLAILVSPLLAIACLQWDLPMAALLPSFVMICGGLGAVRALRQAEAQFHSADLGQMTRASCFALSRQNAEGLLGDSLPAGRSEAVMPRLLALVSEVASIPVEEIRPDSRFIEDLMMG